MIIEGALFGAGRPVIVLRYIEERGLKLDRVMICWDGSHPAARAIADAMPFLARAGTIEVVTIASGRKTDDELPGADMGEHLARHGLEVEVKRIVASGVDVAKADPLARGRSGADFIVMGGFGHSRLREFARGGATHPGRHDGADPDVAWKGRSSTEAGNAEFTVGVAAEKSAASAGNSFLD